MQCGGLPDHGEFHEGTVAASPSQMMPPSGAWPSIPVRPKTFPCPATTSLLSTSTGKQRGSGLF